MAMRGFGCSQSVSACRVMGGGGGGPLHYSVTPVQTESQSLELGVWSWS